MLKRSPSPQRRLPSSALLSQLPDCVCMETVAALCRARPQSGALRNGASAWAKRRDPRTPTAANSDHTPTAVPNPDHMWATDDLIQMFFFLPKLHSSAPPELSMHSAFY